MDTPADKLVPHHITRGTLPPLNLKSRLKKLRDQKYKAHENILDEEYVISRHNHVSPDNPNDFDMTTNVNRPPARIEFHENSDNEFDNETNKENCDRNKYTNNNYNEGISYMDNTDSQYYSDNNKQSYNSHEKDLKGADLESRFIAHNDKNIAQKDENGEDISAQDADDERPPTHLRGDEMETNDIDKLFSLNKINSNSNDKSKPDYREIALDIAMNGNKVKNKKRTKKYCDFVLVYDAFDDDVLHVTERKLFETSLKEENIDVIKTTCGDNIFVELYASFERLCKEAEKIHLQMPLEGFLLESSQRRGILKDFFRSMKTDNEVDMVSAPFCFSSKQIFQGIENTKTFFRSAHRAMLVRHILENKKLSSSKKEDAPNTFIKTGLSALLHSGSYKQAFILHDQSEYDQAFPLKKSIKSTYNMSATSIDPRKNLHDTWLKCFKFQPLWKVRNYFGEKIGLYFAWCGVLITTLWVPVLLGVVVFVFGIISAFPSKNKVSSVSSIMTWMSAAFDNDATPYFALLVCLWGTIFLEIWKRKNAELAYKWDVDSFEEQEPNRPQFYGTKLVKNPVTGVYEEYYPLWRKVVKSMGSVGVILFMVALVLTSVVSVIVYKVVSRVDWFASESRGEFMSSITSSVLNSVSILILGKIYKILAYKLTDWENHQTRTKYEDALILKLFGFQFINSYASLFYIAFFRERTSTGVFKLGSSYSDNCGEDNDCMSLLSIQVAVLMITKPMPKLFSDIILPVFTRVAKKILCCWKSKNKVDTSENHLPRDHSNTDEEYENYLHAEYRKPELGNFTLSEYTEKVLQYGYLMLFAAAFPLAPLIALLTNIIDLRIDARRMLWFNRRPVPQRAQDIGMWYTILTFLNYTGMITNALILGLTSRFGRDFKTSTIEHVVPSNMTLLDIPVNSTLSHLPLFNLTTYSMATIPVVVTTYNNLWIVVLFENVVLAVKFLLSYVIPDVPESVSKAQKQEKIQLELLLSRSGLKRGPGKSIRVRSTNLRDEVDSYLHNEGRGTAKERVRTKRMKR